MPAGGVAGHGGPGAGRAPAGGRADGAAGPPLPAAAQGGAWHATHAAVCQLKRQCVPWNLGIQAWTQLAVCPDAAEVPAAGCVDVRAHDLLHAPS